MKIDEGVYFRGQRYSVYGDLEDGRIKNRGIAWYSTTVDANFVCTEMAESIRVMTCLGDTSLADYLEILAVEQFDENQRRRSA